MIKLPVLGQQRVGLVVGEVAVGRPVGLEQLQVQALEQRPDHRAGHAVAPVEHDLRAAPRRVADGVGVDEAQRRVLEVPVDVDLLEPSPRRRPRDAGLRRPRSPLRPRGGRPGCPTRPTARSPPRAPAWRRCRPWGCARRCTSGRRPARASRRGSRASRCPPCPASMHVHALARAGPRGSAPTAPARSGACRARARPAAARRACPPGATARARTPRRSARPASPSICSP